MMALPRVPSQSKSPTDCHSMAKFSPLWRPATAHSRRPKENAANPLFAVASFTSELAKGRMRLHHAPDDYRARRVLAELLRRRGALREAAMEAHTALSLAEHHADRSFVAWCFWTLSSVSAQRGDWTGARTAAARCAEVAFEHGMKGLVVWATARSAEIQRIRGNYREAAREHGQLLATFENGDDIDGTLWAVQGKAQCDLMLGDVGASLLGYWKSEALSRRVGDLRSAGWALRGTAECFLRIGDLSAARIAALRALATFHECGYTIGQLYSIRTMADIDLVGAPRSALRQALDAIVGLEGSELPRENMYLTAAAARAAHACQHHSLATRLAALTLDTAERLKCALLQVESHLLLAQAYSMTPGDHSWRNHLNQACCIADASGLAVELAAARACLNEPSYLVRLCGYRSGAIFRPQLRLPTTNPLLAE